MELSPQRVAIRTLEEDPHLRVLQAYCGLLGAKFGPHLLAAGALPAAVPSKPRGPPRRGFLSTWLPRPGGSRAAEDAPAPSPVRGQ